MAASNFHFHLLPRLCHVQYSYCWQFGAKQDFSGFLLAVSYLSLWWAPLASCVGGVVLKIDRRWRSSKLTVRMSSSCGDVNVGRIDRLAGIIVLHGLRDWAGTSKLSTKRNRALVAACARSLVQTEGTQSSRAAVLITCFPPRRFCFAGCGEQWMERRCLLRRNNWALNMSGSVKWKREMEWILRQLKLLLSGVCVHRRAKTRGMVRQCFLELKHSINRRTVRSLRCWISWQNFTRKS